MSWACPHEDDGHCNRLKTDCEPTRKGCVLQGKLVRAIDYCPEALQGFTPSSEASKNQDNPETD